MPGVAKETDTSTLIAADRLTALPEVQRGAWEAYLDRSRAAFVSKSFDYRGDATDAMMASDSAQKLVLSMLSYQTPSGGWSKHVDFAHGVRQPGQSFFSENEKWQYIATIDNDAIVEVLQLLDGVASGSVAYVSDSLRKQALVAVTRGIDCILRAQVKADDKLTVWGSSTIPSHSPRPVRAATS